MQETPPLAHTDLLYRSHEEIRAIQNRRFRHQVALCFRAHPYYQDVFNRLKLTPADFQTIEDVQKLPVTTKQDMLRNPKAFRLIPQSDFLPHSTLPMIFLRPWKLSSDFAFFSASPPTIRWSISIR